MKFPSEYRVLCFFEKQLELATSTEAAETLKTPKSTTVDTIKWLRNEGYLQDGMKPVNGIDTMSYRLTPAGKRRLKEIKTERLLFAITAINTLTTVASLITAILGLVIAAA